MSKIYLYSYFPIYSIMNYNGKLSKSDLRPIFIHSLMVGVTIAIILHLTQLIYFFPRNSIGGIFTIVILGSIFYLDYRSFIIKQSSIQNEEEYFSSLNASKRIMLRLLGAVLIFYTFMGAPIYLFLRILLVS